MTENAALILVVDDNEMNRDMLSRRLKRLGHKTMMAEDGQKALEVINQEAFHLVLLDIMMPNLNGYDTLQQLKSNPETQHIPVIMISAVDDLESVVRCIELGAEDYLFKPFNPVLLKARVGASLEKHRLSLSVQEGKGGTAPQQKEIVMSIQDSLEKLKVSLGSLTEEQEDHLNQLSKLVGQLGEG